MFLLVFIGHRTMLPGHAALFTREVLPEINAYFTQNRLQVRAVADAVLNECFETVEQVEKASVLLVQRFGTRGVIWLPG